MNLQEMSTKDLLALHNQIADKAAGPKTFATRGKLLERIESVAAAKNIDVASFGQPQAAEVTEPHAQQQADAVEATEAPTETEKKPSGKGIGRLARELLMDPAGTSHAEIAAEVNRKIPGAQATAKSVRWYAHKMRKDGIQVPSRRKTVIDDGTVQDDSTTP
ncbi:hypothetical protein [Pseudomonas aeruginosa]|uniref:hypothetical protein n=1 Tax=Pseudomonas aeruginosa TaxID=287 RepID=UPI000BB7EDA3|nr:hypothetical protein [Pseudomonas aeruginosa]PBY70636.1 hypothetical protein CJT48_13270 [Pseudomonas aeruginosa]